MSITLKIALPSLELFLFRTYFLALSYSSVLSEHGETDTFCTRIWYCALFITHDSYNSLVAEIQKSEFIKPSNEW
jgi:hypothetical protein